MAAIFITKETYDKKESIVKALENNFKIANPAYGDPTRIMKYTPRAFIDNKLYINFRSGNPFEVIYNNTRIGNASLLKSNETDIVYPIDKAQEFHSYRNKYKDFILCVEAIRCEFCIDYAAIVDKINGKEVTNLTEEEVGNFTTDDW
jgi:hypothetical protein